MCYKHVDFLLGYRQLCLSEQLLTPNLHVSHSLLISSMLRHTLELADSQWLTLKEDTLE